VGAATHCDHRRVDAWHGRPRVLPLDPSAASRGQGPLSIGVDRSHAQGRTRTLGGRRVSVQALHDARPASGSVAAVVPPAGKADRASAVRTLSGYSSLRGFTPWVIAVAPQFSHGLGFLAMW